MNDYRFKRDGAEPTGWEVSVSAWKVSTLTRLAREEMEVSNGAQSALVPVRPTRGCYAALFQFVSQAGAAAFVTRLWGVMPEGPIEIGPIERIK